MINIFLAFRIEASGFYLKKKKADRPLNSFAKRKSKFLQKKATIDEIFVER